MYKSYVFTIPMKGKSDENAVQAYLFGVFAHKEGSIAIHSDNETEFQNTHQLSIKRIFSNLFYPQGNSRIKNMHNIFKRTFTKF